MTKFASLQKCLVSSIVGGIKRFLLVFPTISKLISVTCLSVILMCAVVRGDGKSSPFWSMSRLSMEAAPLLAFGVPWCVPWLCRGCAVVILNGFVRSCFFEEKNKVIFVWNSLN